MINFSVGSLVKARGREWVVLPESQDDLLVLRPLDGLDDEITGIYLILETVSPATFDFPDPTQVGDYRSARMLRDAVRLGFRSSADPFRSDLEKEWPQWIEKGNFRLPSHTQWLIEPCYTRPDIWYEGQHTAVYVDGAHHLYPERRIRDKEQTECMEDIGFAVIRFGILESWQTMINQYSSVFGNG